MNLDTAIEILELNLREAGKKMPADTRDALALAINALIRIKACRQPIAGSPLLPLDGESPNGTMP